MESEENETWVIIFVKVEELEGSWKDRVGVVGGVRGLEEGVERGSWREKVGVGGLEAGP